MSYTHLSQSERYQIYALFRANHPIKFIAKQLQRCPSTISRELRRNLSQRGYRPQFAQSKAVQRRANNSRKLSDNIWPWVIDKLSINWSPEQIAGVHQSISHTSIYRYIHKDKANGGNLWQCLRRKSKPYRKPLVSETRGRIKDRVSIDKRPDIVNTRARLGDWEADTIIGKNHKQAIVTIVERKSGLVKIKKVAHKSASLVAGAMSTLLSPLMLFVKTITSDNGKEFAHHQQVKRDLHAMFYFADTYASWQRGTNENTNGLIREYLPKGCDFRRISDDEIQFIEDRLNERPRKRLGFKSPNEVFFNAI